MIDERPDPLSELAQLITAMANVASNVRGYYVALIENGFSEEQALTPTVAWQTQILRGTQP